MFCTNCGSSLPEGSKFCTNCGSKLQGDIVLESMKFKKAADEIEYTLHGDDMQLVEITLDPGESVISESGAMTYMNADITMETILGDGSIKDKQDTLMNKLTGAGKRALTGESIFMTLFTNSGKNRSFVAFAAHILAR